MPRLPFDKFISAKRNADDPDEGNRRGYEYLHTTSRAALMKAIRSLEQHVDSLISYDFSSFAMRMLMRAAGSGR